MTAPLYLDDLKVGNEFISRRHRIDAEQIIAFAKQFDPQPFHLSEETAQGTFFQGLAASGWHTASISMRLIVETIPLAAGIIGAGAEVSWPQPTRPGDELYVKSTIKDIRLSKSRPDRGIVVVHSVTLNQNDQVCQEFTAKLVAFRKDAERRG